MQNLLIVAGSVASDGALYLPAREGRLGMIDVRDIVEVAARVLTEDGHEAQTYGLTGPESISFHDVAAALSKALDRAVRYVDAPPEAAREAMVDMGVAEWVAAALNEYFGAFSEGLGDYTTRDVEALTGHSPRSIEEFAQDFAEAFAPAAVPA